MRTSEYRGFLLFRGQPGRDTGRGFAGLGFGLRRAYPRNLLAASIPPVGMTQVLFRRHQITYQPFQLGNFRKPAFGLARPDDAAASETHLKDTALGAGHQGHPFQIFLEGAQQFLGHPRGADQPPASGAVFNFDAGS